MLGQLIDQPGAGYLLADCQEIGRLCPARLYVLIPAASGLGIWMGLSEFRARLG